MIPQEKSAAVSRGLREAFSVSSFEEIQSLKSGPSAVQVFRIVVRGSPYLLRIILRADDATRHFNNMRSAAEAGLAPRVWYTNAPDKVSITDFVEAVPFPLTDALVMMPSALRSVHALPRFEGVPNHINTSCMFLLNEGPALDGFLRLFQAANLVPQAESEEMFSCYAQVREVYPHHDADMVSSHNDLKPENIVFDGKKVWLVDWEAAFLNDRYADLAVVANSVVSNEAEERIYLETYFGQEPDAYQQARFFLVRQVVHLFYAMAYLLKGVSGGPVLLTADVPSVTEFHRRIWFDEIHLDDAQLQTAYGRAHWVQFLRNARQARFEECLRIAAEEGK